MNRTMCPGQDTRYWRPDDIFTVPCGSCGAGVEFFKDDAVRRCARCGARIRNPRLSMGCAQWCKHAQECLGYDPHDAAAGAAAGRSVADSIIESLKLEFGAGSALVERSLAAYEKARDFAGREAADPAVLFPSILLLFADSPGGGKPDRRLPVASRIMAEAGVEPAARAAALDLIMAFHTGLDSGPVELRIMKESAASPVS